jgi:hypothetical protein
MENGKKTALHVLSSNRKERKEIYKKGVKNDKQSE